MDKKTGKQSDIISSCKIKLQKKNLQITQVHDPTSDHDNETVDMLYEEKAMDKKACSLHIVMGDFNAETGVRIINENMKCIVPFGAGNRNERGIRLLDFAEENNWKYLIHFSKRQQTDTEHGKNQGV